MNEIDDTTVCPNCATPYRDAAHCPYCGAPRGRRRLDAGTIAAMIAVAVVALCAGAVGTCSMVVAVQSALTPDPYSQVIAFVAVTLLVVATLVAAPCVRILYRFWKRK